MAKEETSPLLDDDDDDDGTKNNNYDNGYKSKAFNQHNFNESLRHGGMKRYKRTSFLGSFGKEYDEFTKSTRKQIGIAALLIQDAINNTNNCSGVDEDENTKGVDRASYYYNPYEDTNKRRIFSLFSRRVLRHPMFCLMVDISVYFMVLLTFFEPPQWCDTVDGNASNRNCQTLLNMRGTPAFVDSEDEMAFVEYYPNSHTMYLTSLESQIIEIMCLVMVTLFTILTFGLEGLSIKRYFSHLLSISKFTFFVKVVQLVSLAALIGGVILGMQLGIAMDSSQYFRIILFATFSPDILREIRTVIRLIPVIIRIYLLFLIVLCFYAWIGVIAFYGSQEGNEHFSNLTEALWTLWTCVTTANYPDVMMPAYNARRISSIFFVSFMIIEFYGFMNVILAVVVQFYHEEDDRIDKEAITHKETKLQQAFEILDRDGNDSIDRSELMEIFPILNDDCPDIKFINDTTAGLLFAILDKDGTNKLSLEEFMNFCEVMLLEFERIENYMSFFERWFPKTYHSPPFQRLCAIVESDKFEKVIDVILVLNAIVVAIQSYPELMGKTITEDPHIADGYIDTPWEIAETWFTFIYCIEMCLKILVYGWKRYMRDTRNFFDFTITILSLAATIYVYYPNAFSDSRLIRYLVMARVLRLFRLVAAMKEFRVIGRTFVGIIPSARRIFLLLFSLMYFFSVIGVHLFGGLITRDPKNELSYLLKDTDFAVNSYWSNNFNDILSGMNILFNLLIINNWPEQASGFEAVTQSKWPRFFFLSFHICGVTIVSNLLVATLIDHFIDEYGKSAIASDDNLAYDDANVDATISENAQALFDAAEITGTKTNLRGRYIARMKFGTDTTAAQKRKIRSLFTKSSS